MVGGSAQAVTGQVLRSRAGHRLLQGALGSALGHRDVDRALAFGAQPALENVAVGGFLRQQHPPRHLGSISAVDLGHNQAHEFRAAQVLHLLGHEATVPDDATAANPEDLH